MMAQLVSAIRDHVRALPPRQAPHETPSRDTLVIAGNGMVGHRLCQRLIELGGHSRYRLVVFGEEPEPAYDRVHLTALFDGQSEHDLQLASSEWYEEHDIALHLGDPIVTIDRRMRAIRSASGREVEYAHLVLATGSSPYVPPIEGLASSGVFVYRTMRDLRAIRRHARGARTAAVIGGGLLGLEAARAVQRLGLQITIVEAAAGLMPTQLDQEAGEELRRHVISLGVRVLTATMTKRVEVRGPRRTLHFAADGSLTVDMVIVAAGIRPRSQLAASCGLQRSNDGGIVVDDRLRTSDPHVSAIGECASHRSKVYGFVAPGYAMADALALTLTGNRAAFSGFAPTARLKMLEADVASAGEPLDPGTIFRYRSDGVYRRIRLERGRLVGALGVGAWPEFGRIQDASARRLRVWPWQLARFERTGTLWPTQRTPTVREWPADAIVCNCFGVTRGQIAVACAAGAASVESVIARTGASTLCGSCRPLLVQALGATDAVDRRVPWGLLGLSAAALAIAVAVVISAPIAYAATVQIPDAVDRLWRDASIHRFTGFSLLAMSAAASLLALRKRWPRLSRGSFPVWRIVHAAIGVLTLATLAAHTGMRLGRNLNFALMACFLAMNVLGAAAAGLTALERRMGIAAPRYRAALVIAHVLATWPVPVLVAFHVASAYYF
jgi:nitrite reductase (NADH) large subunit